MTQPLPYCIDGVAPDGCCLLVAPNTSEWQVVCASPSEQPAVATVPTLSWLGMAALSVAIVIVAVRRLPGGGAA